MGQYRVMGITNIADGNESNRKQKLVVILNHFHGVTMKHWKKYEKPWIVKEKKMTFPMKIIQAKTGDVVCKQCSSCHGCK